MSIRAILIHALLYEALGVQLFSDFDTQLQVLAHERFQALCPLSLTLFFIEHIVVMLYYFFHRFPVVLNHAGGILGALLDFMLHVLSLSFLFELFLVKLLSAYSDILLGIPDLLLCLPLKILGHPLHFLDEEIPMRLLTRLATSPGRQGSGWDISHWDGTET